MQCTNILKDIFEWIVWIVELNWTELKWMKTLNMQKSVRSMRSSTWCVYHLWRNRERMESRTREIPNFSQQSRLFHICVESVSCACLTPLKSRPDVFPPTHFIFSHLIQSYNGQYDISEPLTIERSTNLSSVEGYIAKLIRYLSEFSDNIWMNIHNVQTLVMTFESMVISRLHRPTLIRFVSVNLVVESRTVNYYSTDWNFEYFACWVHRLLAFTSKSWEKLRNDGKTKIVNHDDKDRASQSATRRIAIISCPNWQNTIFRL
jgi:hypothetical protein